MKTISEKISALPKEKLLSLLFESVDSNSEQEQLFQAIFTPAERKILAERADIFRGILSHKTQRTIAKELGASLATVSRGSRVVKYGSGIVQKLFQRIEGNLKFKIS